MIITPPPSTPIAFRSHMRGIRYANRRVRKPRAKRPLGLLNRLLVWFANL